ncbi:enoyl-CoA hydratase/isomerase family protein [Arthrobacter sp. SDTb3-6]|uniref:enoyl-CoA hydratase/isomerase family protein n=1 Tax=Arthrobacter sp. SDTb3-6 TaxID=2713571 RepID=UPI00159D4904|nr:enoyl-CoA hydratase-related protein [Arthrobacter sp. SDTb3-6]NVN00132.1 enoyl-CoA hydratase/isomerase family protein [Arthrobacter sp. SDTb3-6]
MSYETILTGVRDGLGTITINRPAARNALNWTVLEEIAEVLAAWREDPEVGVVVFTGAGEKAFVAGADINQLAGYTMADGLSGAMAGLYDTVEAYEKPTIAAINGFALGGGNELAMSCDIRIAADTARFGLPETNLGVLPGAGGTQRLSRLVGKGRAVELILTGRIFDAGEALRIGLVTEVTAPEGLRAAVERTAGLILAKGPLAVRLGKLVITNGAETDLRTGLLLERLAQSLLYTSNDKREGAAAFLEKRPARFEGN